MKILLSWIKKFINFNFSYKKIYNIFNYLGIEIISIKKVYPIKYINNYKKIKKYNILHIYKSKRKYFFLIKKNKNKKFIYNNFYLKKNTKILIEKKNGKYNIVGSSYSIDYIINSKFTPNINYLSYYINLFKNIIFYLRYKGYIIKLYKFKKKKEINNINKYNFKIPILYNKKRICFFKAFYIKNTIKKSSYKEINKIILSNDLDIKNYINNAINIIMKETGVPIQIFNIDKINNLIIKENKENRNFYFKKEKFIKLKKTHKDILIYNNLSPISLYGIINKYNYNINNAKNYLLLITIYNRYDVLKCSYINKINTFSSNLYKNKINIYNLKYVINKLKYLFKNNIKEIYTFNNIKEKNKLITLKYNYIYEFIGIKIKKNYILKILKSLNYKLIKKNKYLIKINTNNNIYIKDKIDILNEIIKILNINKINNYKNNIPLLFKKNNTYYYKIEQTIINFLINYGMYEVINTPFIYLKKINFNKKRNIRIKHNFYLRNKLDDSLINNILYNINRKKYSLKFFEISNCYFINKKNKIKGKKYLVISITKKNTINYINDLYKLYNIIILILEKIGIKHYKKKIFINNKKNIEIIIFYKKKKIIRINKIKILKINQFIFTSRINIKTIIKILRKKKRIKYKKYSKYQYINKDLTFIVNKDIYYDNFYKLSKKKLKNKLIKLKLFDIYNKNLPINKKSYTFRFIIKNKVGISKKTINNLLRNLINIFYKKLGAKLKEIN
ncbi:MAG: phenylalanine--tRNA ligase beta subunit-related protein [Candidatus Shikimatogenerans bostrichidophilus]|nr:MAG: phenylalanine--tRNA ligase beta subunit-related protein [Candidatus Shikimatogenerans bostrichidophilus]